VISWVRSKKMRHGISEQQWIEYLEGGLAELDAARVGGHLSACPECAATFAELSLWRGKLVEEAARVRAAFETSPDQLDRLLAASLERIGRSHPSWTFREAVMLLRLLVEPFCGSGTAGAAVRLAVQRSMVHGRPAPATWDLFVSNMSEMMSSVCGTEAGRLVNQVGVWLHVAQV
jgi:anti-sigma factor RsiW